MILDTTWERLSSHWLLLHRAGTAPDRAPVITVGLEPVGSLQNWSRARDGCPAVPEVAAALLPWTAPPFVSYPHTSHVGSHARQGSTQSVCDFDSLRGWIPDCALQSRGSVTMFFSLEHRDLQHKQNPFKPTLTTTLNPRRQKWNWQSRRQMSISSTLMPTCSTRNHTHTKTNTMRHGPFINHSRGVAIGGVGYLKIWRRMVD